MNAYMYFPSMKTKKFGNKMNCTNDAVDLVRNTNTAIFF